MIAIEKGLVIDDPWIGLILEGKKDWEMRSTLTNHRGWFGLIRKGSGLVIGLAFLERVSGPYNNDQLLVDIQHHKVPENHFRKEGYNWRHAWHLSNVIKLDKPVHYQHKSGAVTWVKLDRVVSEELAKILQSKNGGAPVQEQAPPKVVQSTSPEEPKKSVPQKNQSIDHGPGQIPMARDGSTFTEGTCNGTGKYTIGDKGSEQRLTNYLEALAALRKMPTAKWRRPNSRGNWGIVSAVRWVDASELLKK